MASKGEQAKIPFLFVGVFIICLVAFIFFWNYVCTPTNFKNLDCRAENCTGGGYPKGNATAGICSQKDCEPVCRYFINQGLFIAIILSSACIIGYSIIWISRYFMPHVAVNGCCGSTDGPPVCIKDHNEKEWLIFNLGDSHYPTPMRGKLGTLVVPKLLMRHEGRHWVGTVFAQRTPFKRLPPALFSYLYHNSSDYNTKEVFFGQYTTGDFALLSSVDLHRDEIISDLNIRYNSRQKLLEGDHEDIEELIETGKEVLGVGTITWPWKKKKEGGGNEEQ